MRINNAIMHRFPVIELSYGQIDHTKVPFDLYSIIPCGHKMFAWFTYYEGQQVCIIIDAKTRTISEVTTTIFDGTLSLGTILYGTMIIYNKNKIFVTEDLCYYKNKPISRACNQEKMKHMSYMFQYELQMTPFFNTMVTFGLPVMKSTLQEAMETANTLTYKVYAIQCMNANTNRRFNKVIFNKNRVEEVTNAILKIVPHIQCDTYEAFGFLDGKMVSMGYTSIQNYDTSVMMNKLFRNIKENENLDALEESDDDEDFENICDDKYVYLEKSYNMDCVYDPTRRKWVPKRVAKTFKVTDVKGLMFGISQQRKNKNINR